MEKDLISVIITTYKRSPEMVNKAIQSVLNQTYQKFEIIIVDDSPEDFERRQDVEKMILAIKDKRIRYIKHLINKGACAARNTGINESKGSYLAFLDDDDEWLPSKLEKQIKMMSDPSIGLVYCRQKIVDHKNRKEIINNRMCYSGQVFNKLIVGNFIGSTSFVLIRRVCIEECGLFDTNMKSAQDYEMWLRIARKYKITYVDEPLVIYNEHDQERISTKYENKIQGLELLNTYYRDYLNMHKKIKSIRNIKIVPYYLAIGDINKAVNVYWQAVKLAPLNIKWNLKYLCYFFRK